MIWPFSKNARMRMFSPPEWHWAQTGDVGWWVRDDWRRALLGPAGLKLAEWRAQNRVDIVKTGPHRVVYRVDLPEGSVYVKHYLVPGWPAKLRQWFRRGDLYSSYNRLRSCNRRAFIAAAKSR